MWLLADAVVCDESSLIGVLYNQLMSFHVMRTNTIREKIGWA